MALDAYSPCPCGSGKKLKFCCQPIVGEMEKIERYQEGQQWRLALQALDALEKKHPGNAWVTTTKAEVLLQEGDADEATELLEAFVAKHADHKYAAGLLAVSAFSASGYELAKPAIHRAFQRCSRDFPALTADLAIGIAASMLNAGRFLSARAHLALALRMAPDDAKQDIFLRLLDFDGNRRVPFPLRSVHELEPYEGTPERMEQARKAVALSNIGCWRPAARILQKLTADDGDNPALWYNLGLCHAWDGDETHAAEALHEAAKQQSDLETAVEWETLAQLLDYNITEDRVQFITQHYEITSTAKLLGVLDDAEPACRIPVEPGDGAPVGMFYIVDHPERLQEPPESLTLDTVPRIRGQVTIFDAVKDDGDEKPARGYVTGREGDEIETAKKQFAEIAGDLVKPSDPDDDEVESTPTIPKELGSLLWRWHFPEKTPISVRRRLEHGMWDRVTSESWTATPLACLSGKSPNEAAGDDSLKVPLRAAISVLDAYCDRSMYCLDRVALMEKLKVEPPATMSVDSDDSLKSLTAQQLQRVSIAELSDDQVASLVHRAVLIHHGGMLYDILSAAAARPECLKRFDKQRIFGTLADACQEKGRYDEALQWIARGREIAKSEERPFENTLQWVIRELTVRIETPADVGIMPLLRHIGEYYLPKLPELAPNLNQILDSVGITPPWDEDGLVATSGAPPAGVWTPGAAEQPVQGGSKLWLPGQ